MFTERTKIDNISLIYGTDNNHPETPPTGIGDWMVFKLKKKINNALYRCYTPLEHAVPKLTKPRERSRSRENFARRDGVVGHARATDKR